MSFWQSLIGNIFGFGGCKLAGDHPVPLVGAAGGNPLPRYTTATATTNGTANLSWDTAGALTVTPTNYNFYIEPGANIQIQPGALGGEATIRTHYDQRSMDRLFVFDNNGAGTADNSIATWNNGTTTASIQNLRIHEEEWRMQQTARAAGQYIQGRLNDHLNQHMDNLLGAQLRGQPQINIGQQGQQGQADIFRPFGGGLRHPTPPNLETPRAIAEVRGNKLLKNIIGDILYRHYEKHGYVDLPSIQKPGVGFRLRAHRRIGLLKQDRQGKWIEQKESLCIHAAGGYWVEGDQVGIHYMLCQCDETKLWKQAIVHRVAA